MTDSHGKFYWNELMAHDVAKAKKFYADALGWSFDAMPMPGGGTYWLAKMGDEPVGGIFDISRGRCRRSRQESRRLRRQDHEARL
jgi:predicted enzyme related to lactoylglutathione lyase